MAGPTPRLSVHTGAGPSTPAAPRRPQGARRRGVAPGLFIANPDNSDEETDGSPSNLPTANSSGAQRSPTRSSPVTISSGGSMKKVPSGGSIAIPLTATSGSPRSNPLPPIPSIPAPQSSPLPHVPNVSSPQPISSIPAPPPMIPSHTTTSIPQTHPPQPPPQPERHLRRAQTTPMPAEHPARGHEHRPSLGSTNFALPPSSPSRALPPLPPLPSPPATNGGLPSSPRPSASPLVPSSAPPTTTSYPQTPASSHSHGSGEIPQIVALQPRMASPETVLSPANTVDSARSFGSLETGNRARSGSVQSSKVRVQVTTDNESFTTVDITGMQTAEGIKERVFSKVSHNDFLSLTLATV